MYIDPTQQTGKLEFVGQGPQPMRYGSVGSPVSTGAARNGVRSASVLIYKLEFDGLKKMLSLRTQTEACHCEPVRTLANPPDFQDTIIEQLPLFFCVYGRTGPVLADRKIRGIATPACALVRNDMFYFSAINTNLSLCRVRIAFSFLL